MVIRQAVAAQQPEGTAVVGPPFALLGRGVHEISAEHYHSDPAPKPSLSASLAHLLVTRSPRHAWLASPRLNPDFQPTNDPKFDIGRAAHSLLLEGAARFAVIDSPTWRSEAARDERAQVYREGLIPLLEHEWAAVSTMVKSVRLQLRQHADARDAFRKGQPERTLIWREGPIWCRARLDWSRRRGHHIEVFDFKSTEGSAAPQTWADRSMWEIGGAIQAAFYARGVRALLRRPAVFKFVVAEIDPPFGLSVVELSPEAQEIADFQVGQAIDAWAICQRRGKWPGYAARTYAAGPPAWLAKQIEAQKMQRAVDHDRRIDPFKLSIALWRPANDPRP
jgi:hypothetical protein